jgi:hypothetical protein
MRKIYILLLILCISCKQLCKDTSFSIYKVPYNGTLRLNGYYYEEPKDSLTTIYVLYNDGIVCLPGSPTISKMDKYILENNNSTILKDSKYAWGVFNIVGNIIKIEEWEPTMCGYPVRLSTGTILNDSTYIITQYSLRTGSKTNTTNDVKMIYHFRKFNPKPDSTNSYVK